MTNKEAIEYLNDEFVDDSSVFAPTRNNVLQMAIEALEKQIPKKPILSEEQPIRYVKTYMCPVCKKGITGTNIAKWCYHCGQKLDWTEVE